MHRTTIGLTLAVTLLLLGAAPDTATQGAAQGRGPVDRVNGRDAAAGEVLVKFRPGLTPEQVTAVTRLADPSSVRPVGRTGVRRVRSRSLDAAALLARFTGHPDVVFAEPNFVVHASTVPADPYAPQLWALANVGQAVNGGGPGRPGADIHAEGAWDVSLGAASHVVAVIDTGIDYAHPDLAPNMWTAPSAFTVTIGGVPVTCPAGSHGFDARTFTCDPRDDQGHGTHVSGTIGAAGGNGLGVVGVNWTTRLMGVKFLDASGAGTVADAIDGIEFAVQAREAFAGTGGADVRVLSNSWGGRDFSQALEDEIAATAAAGMLFVAAAGNDGFSNDLWPAYPASYPLPNVVAVAATTNTDDRAWFSNYGTRSVHLGAPGVDILSTAIGGTYAYMSGTSMAAPHVSGAAMLVLSRCDLDTPRLRQALLATVEPVAGLAAYTLTGGRLDVNGAIRSCSAAPDRPADLTARGADGSVALSWSRDEGATGYIVKRSLAAGGPYTTLATTSTANAYTDRAVTNGTTYFYVVSAVNFLGESEDSTEASATPKAPSDLVVPVLSVPTTGGAGLTIAIGDGTKNQGPGPSFATTTRFYLSRNSLLDATDTVIGARPVPALAPGAQSDGALAATLPDALSPGYYFVLAKADADGAETETQEFNNVTSRLITIGPDLVVSAFGVPAAAGPGTAIGVTVTARNQGGGAAAASVTRFYLSANAAWDASDVALAGGLDTPALAPSATWAGSATVTIPPGTASGSWYLVAKCDGDAAVAETQEANNTAARMVQVGGNLVVSGLTLPAKGAAGEPLVVTDTTKNTGAGSIQASVTRFYVSANAVLDAGDTLLAGGRAVPALAPGASSTGSVTVTMPGSLSPGTYFVIARADADGLVAETLETDNTLARSISVGPDLVISAMTVPYNVRAGLAVAIADTVQNQGAGAAAASTTRFFLSANVAFDQSDVLLAGSRDVPALAAGGTSSGTTSVVIPAGTAPGAWFVIARADADGVVAEGQESNNVAARAIQVAP